MVRPPCWLTTVSLSSLHVSGGLRCQYYNLIQRDLIGSIVWGIRVVSLVRVCNMRLHSYSNDLEHYGSHKLLRECNEEHTVRFL